ncbi:hypothetical protein EVAR_6823_1 [Eumeta japonica]|uniref:Uncharacterized protein n=1 Tax=Eumeta variegata TaxID=151549 RepID=A0A4C1U6B3_EUMVA|nr:hypothetical protein EVAR_6823_1 [Eumeta japonica]
MCQSGTFHTNQAHLPDVPADAADDPCPDLMTMSGIEDVTTRSPTHIVIDWFNLFRHTEKRIILELAEMELLDTEADTFVYVEAAPLGKQNMGP